MNTIRLKFLGAIGTVTGSCTLMEYNREHYYLVDAGIYQNEANNEDENIRKKILKTYTYKIKIVFITHAHLDHIGLLPELVKWGFTGKIYGTKATIELTKIMLEDAMKINGDDLVTIKNTIKSMAFYEFDSNHGETTFTGFGKKYSNIAKDFAVTILRSSHILGSCTWLFRWSENEYEDDITFDQKEWRYIYFTGDIGTVRGNINSNILFKEHQIPFSNPNKIVIMESTYGGIIREKKDNIYEERIAKLADIIFTNFQNGGFILIPVFALDRAQQLLVDLYYIISKYTINGKKWHEPEVLNFNWNKILLNKDKITLLKLLII